MDKLGRFSYIFDKEDNFCDFLYGFLHTGQHPLLKTGLLYMERMTSQEEQIITKTRLFKHTETFTKKWKFSDKNSDIFFLLFLLET